MVAITLDYRHVFVFITHSPSHNSMLYRTPMYNWQINKTQIYEKWVSYDAINLHRMTIIMRVLWSKVTFINIYFSRFQLCKLTWCRLHATHSCLLPQCYCPGLCVCVCARVRACSERLRFKFSWPSGSCTDNLHCFLSCNCHFSAP